MAKTINIALTEKSIRDAIKQLEAYRDRFDSKLDLFLSRLAEVGIEVARATIESVPQDDKGQYALEEIKSPPNGTSIVLSGNKVLFIEFGAGITYSNPQHPKANGKYGVGTYPDQKHAFDPKGWWYTDNGTHSNHSYGNPPYMPLYKAETEILNRVHEIAKEVFGG